MCENNSQLPHDVLSSLMYYIDTMVGRYYQGDVWGLENSFWCRIIHHLPSPKLPSNPGKPLHIEGLLQ